MTSVQLDPEILDRLRSEKVFSRDTYNDVLRRMFKIIDNIKKPALVDKDKVK